MTTQVRPVQAMRNSTMNLQWSDESQTLSGIVEINGTATYVSIPRAMVHTIHIYNDAVGWEIERFKQDIVERLKHTLAVTPPDQCEADECDKK